MKPTSTDKILAIVAHLSYFSAVGYILGPLLIFLLKKDSEFVSQHAKQALVWQGGLCIIGILVGAGCSIVTFLTAGLAIFLIVPAAILAVALLVVPSIVASFKALNDEYYSYPLLGEYAKKL